VSASNLPVSTWAEFSFTTAGTPATGCGQVDPTDNFCVPSSGTPAEFLGTPPWTFTSVLISFLTVTDAFQAGDQFQVFDFGVPVGITSQPSGNADCGDDPVPCLAALDVSHGQFNLAAGDHQISIVPTLASGGSGFLRVDPVPEPSAWMLLAGGFTAIWLSRRRPR
jgi:hypothetical protein